MSPCHPFQFAILLLLERRFIPLVVAFVAVAFRVPSRPVKIDDATLVAPIALSAKNC
jgi:hypothetical protein